ncbi:hypothetical protein Aglo01_66520 [Actinokineospora globicatena]|uniref:Uncharacterized protein n=1 Tax=Actinokineospora globicatena TaxID=103729 RepID=A0A9W6V9C2_9PSEU|nr:hypothetical protein Aglo01_66520 [Actinokineospora globicatena]GLW88964.1 hypothetical protein Aglo02_66030 [Actinokineospora globicatena]GLW94955.1 hypothetical protein Aglo03_57710 [Actinokineospora globicatena]
MYSGIACSPARSAVNRSSAACTLRSRIWSAASAGLTCTNSSGTRGDRSAHNRDHFEGITPGAYASLKGAAGSGPVTRPDYRR